MTVLKDCNNEIIRTIDKTILIIRRSSMLTTKPLYYSTVRSVPFSTTLCVPEQAVWRRKRGHVASGGSYSRNKGNDLDHSLGTNFFRDIERSDAGSLVTDAWQGLLNANWSKILVGVGLILAAIFMPGVIVAALGIYLDVALKYLIISGSIYIVEGIVRMVGEDGRHQSES
jgi:hypothetical protein